MRRPDWSEDWVEPDLESLGLTREDIEEIGLPFVGYTRRSIIPDGLSVLIAAESGKPILYPVFPINGFTPKNGCDAHHGSIPEGHSAYCPGCHDTGLRDHPALKLDPADIPAPEPKSVEVTAEPESDPQPAP
ncbi:MAG: hypothetical protein KGR26_07250, partial [Cyanobacteria bacterium REEB65]|nr:hypothetical protein [Cyanobacteria bacterium REEB65]